MNVIKELTIVLLFALIYTSSSRQTIEDNIEESKEMVISSLFDFFLVHYDEVKELDVKFDDIFVDRGLVIFLTGETKSFVRDRWTPSERFFAEVLVRKSGLDLAKITFGDDINISSRVILKKPLDARAFLIQRIKEERTWKFDKSDLNVKGRFISNTNSEIKILVDNELKSFKIESLSEEDCNWLKNFAIIKPNKLEKRLLNDVKKAKDDCQREIKRLEIVLNVYKDILNVDSYKKSILILQERIKQLEFVESSIMN